MSLVLLEMPGLKSKCLSMCSPEYRVPQLRSQQDAATAETGTRGTKYRQKENSSSSSWDVSAVSPRGKRDRNMGPRSTGGMSRLGSHGDPNGDVILFLPLQGPMLLRLHLNLRDTTNSSKKWMGTGQTWIWRLCTWLQAVCGQSQHVTWGDQVTHHVTSASRIKHRHREYLNLSLVNEVCYSVNTVLSAIHVLQHSFLLMRLMSLVSQGLL